jgi:hypothetical protein
MKKFLLLLVAAVLVSGLVLSCAQPSSFEVTLAPGSAPEVDGTKIVATALTNAILVKWAAAQDSSGYYVYRKEVTADGPQDSTLVLRSQGASSTPKGVPYYFDTGIVNGKKYQYGIVSQSYKSGTDVVLRSEIIWQEETEADKFATASVAAVGEVAITAPTYTIGKINSTAAGTVALGTDKDFVEDFLLTIDGLVPGIKYTFIPEWENDNSSTSTTWYSITASYDNNGNPLTYFSYTLGQYSAPDIGTYVDDNNKIILNYKVSSGAQNRGVDTYYQYYGFRVRVSYDLPSGGSGNTILYPSDAGYYIKTPNPTTALVTSSTISVSP